MVLDSAFFKLEDFRMDNILNFKYMILELCFEETIFEVCLRLLF